MTGARGMDAVTQDVLSQKLDDIKERLIVIESEMKAIRGVDKTANQALSEVRNLKEKVENIDANITWVWRAFGLAVIAEICRIAFSR